MSKGVEFFKWRAHPWHGLPAGEDTPQWVNVFVEITQFDSMKYEIDKETGYLRIDRPQRNSSLPPCAYGFIPRTYCDRRVAGLAKGAQRGDKDPLDVCVISEMPINRAEVIVSAKVIGGFRMIDDDEADDKIIAIMKGDAAWGEVEDIKALPRPLVDRLKHYFLTYKMTPKETTEVSIESMYGAKAAQKVVQASLDDYADTYASE